MVGLERGTVELELYDPTWREAYETEVERLRGLVGGRVRSFEHVGSTAVEGLPAKPVIDLLAVVADLEESDDLVAVLQSNGYEHRPNDDVPDRVFLAKGPRENRTHYLSLVKRGSDCYREQVAFRDYLRDNPTVAETYAARKRELAAESPDDRESYTAGKSAFVERVLEAALE
jgi:GrpB-like predicted nucleotidyltransferase (UPF0157 family)